MFCADDWPDLDESAFQTHEVARALVAAVKSSAHNKSDVILGATAVLLGQKGLEAQRADHERIAQGGPDAAGCDAGGAHHEGTYFTLCR